MGRASLFTMEELGVEATFLLELLQDLWSHHMSQVCYYDCHEKSVGLEILIYTLFREDSELPFCGPKVKPDATEKGGGGGAQWAHPSHSQ